MGYRHGPSLKRKLSAIRLLVLGAVRRRGRAHGYQVRSDLESWGAHEWSTAAPGSIYHALKAMAREGLLVAHEELASEAGGPPRTEYELSGDGEAAYLALLRATLTSREPRLDLLAAAVGLIDDLSREEAVSLLRERGRAMTTWRDSITAHLPPGSDLDEWGPVGEVVRLWLETAESRLRWTERLVERLEGGDFRMADDA